MRRIGTTLFCLFVAGLFFTDTVVWAQKAQVVEASRFNTSQPLRDMINTTAPAAPRAPYAIQNKLFKMGGGGEAFDQPISFADPVQQAVMGPLAPTIGVNFEGSSDDDNAVVAGGRIVPPDTDGDVGPNHYVQWINLVSEIFDKNGTTIQGPFVGNAYFSGLGGICQSTNDGDPIVLYDEAADRWLVSQFAVPGPSYSMCIAISQTADPTGAYHQYEFSFGSDFPDYPKLGIWNDSYVMTTRDFANGQSFAGISAVALDRAAMLSGASATMVRFPDAFPGNIDGYLPADSDAPISGPAIFGGHGADGDTTFELWELDVDWNNPGAATFTSVPGGGVTISPYDGVVPSINQPSPGELLDDLSFFTMHRLNVRDFGTHVSMVANHTVETSPGTAGIRWYEFRNTGSGWTLYQEGTYSPDSNDRWMGSIAINAAGDIALGYSVSGSSTFPSIRFTGQTADQSGSGSMNIAETEIIAGSGAQISSFNRWGDYSMTSVDPVDDSFWFTTEYYANTNNFDFKTRIANFTLSSGPVNQPPVVTITAPADGSSFNLGDNINFTGTANDPEDLDISGDIMWSSSINGPIGTGASINVSTLSVGVHTITAEATDSGVPAPPRTGTDQITVTIVGPTPMTMHVHFNIVQGTQGGGKKKGTATVTIYDNLEDPVANANVTVQFSGDFNESVSGTTNGSGEVMVVTSARKKNPSFTTCVDAVTHGTLTYDSGKNENEETDCGSGSGGTDVHVQNIVTGTQGNGRKKKGTATVTVMDDLGNPAVGYTVMGTFGGSFNETRTGTTNASGVATIVTSSRETNPPAPSFCVNSVLGALPYDPADNANPAYDCGASKGALAGETPEGFALDQNYPNPFNPSTVIAYSLAEAGPVTLKVYNVLGQEVATLVDGHIASGRHQVVFDASRLSAGVYLYVIKSGSFTATQRMTLLK